MLVTLGFTLQVVESDDSSGDNDDKVIVAMGILNTIESVLTVIEDSAEILSQVEPIILQIIAFIIQTQCMGKPILQLCIATADMNVSFCL